MNASLFLEYIDKYFRLVVGKITEKFNDKSKEPTLLHKTMLTEEYSADLSWGATELNNSVVAADVVSLDSSLPLKSRSKISNATGKLPKLGLKMRKGEKLISDINVMVARGAEESAIAAKIFDDTTKVIKSMDIRKEIMFLQALSTGACLVEDDDENTGTGIRVEFGYKDENSFKCIGSEWGQAGETPQDDIQQMFDKALEDSNSISHVYLSKKYFDRFRHSKQGKLLVANFNNSVVTNIALLPVPSRATFLEALADEYGATFHVVNSVFKVEKSDGTKLNVKPWKEANVVGVPSNVVGRLVYGTLAEETNPVEGVKYQKSGSHILVSKYSKTDPLEEFTAAQALCLPVIDGADSIYVLHADEKWLTIDNSKLAFPKSASSREITVTADGNVTAKASESWLTPTVASGKVTVAATANTGAARTATITISDENGHTAIVEVTQADGTTA